RGLGLEPGGTRVPAALAASHLPWLAEARALLRSQAQVTDSRTPAARAVHGPPQRPPLRRLIWTLPASAFATVTCLRSRDRRSVILLRPRWFPSTCAALKDSLVRDPFHFLLPESLTAA
ncbi:hypothetical protein P7K49_026175, partial [Saguinus oedipus]